MKRSLRLALFPLFYLYAMGLVATVYASEPAEVIASHTSEIDGAKLHYMTAGKGPALILLARLR